MPSKRVHFIGLCGAGMSAVAFLLKDAGWEVTGSDAEFYPPISDLISSQGLRCFTPHAATNIPKSVDLIVIGKHAKLVPDQNEEVREAFRRKEAGTAEVKSYPDVLHDLTTGKHNIVVVGSYGKSTTTSLISWILKKSHKNPSYFIGAVPVGFERNAASGDGHYFVLEGDEYPSANWDHSPKFVHYNATTVVLTSGEYDHFNEYPTLDSYLEPYHQLIAGLPTDGLLVACKDGANVDRLTKNAPCRVVTYSIDPTSGADYYLSHVSTDGHRTVFSVYQPNHEVLELSTSLLGKHNLQNIIGAVAACLEQNAVTPQEAAAAVSTFAGIKRRLELKTEKSTIPVYEDLSSSRAKGMAALSAIAERYANQRLIAVFQPHTFSFRSRKALEWYPGMFAKADSVFIYSPPTLRGLASNEQLSHEEIVESIRNGNPNLQVVATVTSPEDAVTQLSQYLKADDVLLLMTSGGMGGSIDSIIHLVESKFPRP